MGPTSSPAVGWRSNPWLPGGIAFEPAFAAALTWIPPLQPVFGTAGVPWEALASCAATGSGALRKARPGGAAIHR